jgi:DNA-binding transcriptional LysR family regulator
MLSTKDLTIQQLRCFVAVADAGQFTAAAEMLKLAQPSLSSQIGRLERVLGVTLFHRDHRPLVPTDAGLELLPLARRVLSSLDDVIHGVSDIEGLRRGHVAIGATPSLGAALLPKALAKFHRRYPGISITFSERDSVVLVEELESGALDLALVIMPLQRPDLEDVVLASEELVVVVANDHQLAERRRITIADLANVPMIMFSEGYDLRSATLDAFTRAGVPITVAMDGAEMGSVLSFVSAGLGAAIVPSISASDTPEMRTLHLRSPTLERQIRLVRPLGHVASRAAVALSHEIINHLHEEGWPKKPSH